MRKLMYFLLFALLMATSTDVLADGRHPRDRVRNGEIQRLDQILPHLRSSYPGTFYDADGPFPDGRGGYRYRIKWLTPEGRVIWLDTDARTGHVIGTNKSERRERDSRERDSSSRDRDARDPWGRDRDEDTARRDRNDRPTVNPWDRGDRRHRENSDRDRSRSEHNSEDRQADRHPDRHNDNNNERFNRASRDNPGRDNRPGDDRHRRH